MKKKADHGDSNIDLDGTQIHFEMGGEWANVTNVWYNLYELNVHAVCKHISWK